MSTGNEGAVDVAGCVSTGATARMGPVSFLPPYLENMFVNK